MRKNAIIFGRQLAHDLLTGILIGLLLVHSLMKKHRYLFLLMLLVIANACKCVLVNYWLAFGNPYVSAIIFNSIFTLLITSTVFIALIGYCPRSVFLTFIALQALYLFTMLTYFLYSGNNVSITMVKSLLSETRDIVQKEGLPFYWKSIVAFADFPAYIFVFFKFSEFRKLFRVSKIRPLFLIGICISLIMALFATALRKGKGPLDNLNTNAYIVIGRYGILTQQIFDFVYNVKKLPILKYGAEIAVRGSPEPHPNIVLIQVESLDANIMSYRHHGEYIAKNLKKIADSNLYFPFMLSILGAGGSSDAEVATINSAEPSRSYPTTKSAKMIYPNSSIQKLHSSGYTTVAFHDNDKEYYSRSIALPKMGFQSFLGRKEMRLSKFRWGGSDGEMFDYILKYSTHLKSPFLLYVITLSSHIPFTLVNDYYSTHEFDDVKNNTVRNYFTSISYVDSIIGHFVNQMTARKNTIVIIYGDHSPGIKKDEYEDASVISGNNKLRFVPLIIASKEHSFRAVDSVAVSFLDIAPTILQLSGITCSYFSDGQPLINAEGIDSKIPYNGSLYDRKDLFHRISASR